MFFILSEMNYDFASQKAFAEDNGPHTGFKSFVLEKQMMPWPDAILTLRILAGFELPQSLGAKADVNNDGKISTEEAIWVLQEISGLR